MEEFCYGKGDKALEPVAQRDCGVSCYGDTQDLSGCLRVRPIVGNLLLAGGWACSTGPFLPLQFCDSGMKFH